MKLAEAQKEARVQRPAHRAPEPARKPTASLAIGAVSRRRIEAVLHHVSLEVPSSEVERTVEFWRLLGFKRLSAPGPIAPYVTWLERGGNQIHLIHTDQPTIPQLGHAAIVAEDLQATLDRLGQAGFEVEETRELWGERRAFATAPGGHRVELMAAPPAPSN
jgi:catechol 2,3-dioxygenase-like lactoylglutathione lyase family enzyme